MNLFINAIIITLLTTSHLITIHSSVYALNINLNSFWNLLGFDNDDDDYEDIRNKLIRPRRDLIKEVGSEENYHRLVNNALGIDSNVGGESSYVDEVSNQRYGVDVSFPMHHVPSSSTNHNANIVYQNYINECNQYYTSPDTNISKESPSLPCNEADQDRFDMNLNQPPVMQNYTMIGFHKTSIPKELFQQLSTFWKNHHMKQKKEVWGKKEKDGIVNADTHVNHWSSPTYMVHIDNPYFEGGGMELKNYIWNVARQKLETWINNGGGADGFGLSRSIDRNTNDDNEKMWTLSPTSIYGIRVYKEGSILAPHVDRLPLVTSAIINVDQDVDEDWPLEVIGHDGVAYNITMEPGDMLLYESHSIIHGKKVVLLSVKY